MVVYGMASGPLTDILLPGTPTLGNPKAPVLLVEFSDFTCGYCGKFFRETLPALKTEYLKAGKVRFAYRDYPRDEEGWGLVSAHAARCAGEQGKFWEMHDRLFANQRAIEPLKGHAEALGLDVVAFESCMGGGKYAEAVRKDMAQAEKAGVTGTPSFVLGRAESGDPTKVRGITFIRGAQQFAAFKTEIEKALAEVEK